MQHISGRTPERHGLYDPSFEHDSCGVSFVAHLHGVASRELIDTALTALTNLDHRGATGAEPDTGDGAGILVQVPDRFLPRRTWGRPPFRRPVRRRPRVPAGRDARRREGRGGDPGHRRRRRIGGRRLARRPGAPRLPRCDGSVGDAEVPPARRQRSGWRRRDPSRPQDVRRAQTHRARARGRHRHLPAVAVRPHPRLQGDADDAPARRVLP